jgi:hypothetical protein
MRSYPNLIPLSAGEVEAIGKAMAPFEFETIYGHYFDRVVERDGRAVLEKSVARYVANLNGTARPAKTGWASRHKSRGSRSSRRTACWPGPMA